MLQYLWVNFCHLKSHFSFGSLLLTISGFVNLSEERHDLISTDACTDLLTVGRESESSSRHVSYRRKCLWALFSSLSLFVSLSLRL